MAFGFAGSVDGVVKRTRSPAVRNIIERARAIRAGFKVREIAREQKVCEALETCGQAGSVGVEFSPEMDAAIVGVVGLKDEEAAQLALETDVGLIAFGNS